MQNGLMGRYESVKEKKKKKNKFESLKSNAGAFISLYTFTPFHWEMGKRNI